MKKHYRTEKDCLNCGAVLRGHFCHACGQENLQVRESFGHMMNHAISDYFHFDHQFFHTLKPLFFKPGFLTEEYMAGRRVQYLHPVKMYIFISIVYFLVLFQTGHQLVNLHSSGTPQTAQMAIDSIERDPEIPNYLKRTLIKQIQLGTPKAHSNVTFNKGMGNADSISNKYFLSPTSNDTSYAVYLKSQQKLPPNQQDGIITQYYNKKAFEYKAEYGSRTKEVIIEQFQHNIPKMMFLLLPLCALILLVAFRNNKKYYVENLIYSFHLHCFIFLFLAIIILLEWLIPSQWVNGILSFLAFVGVVWYCYRSLRVVYERSRWRTVSKLIGVSLMYFTSFIVCIALAFIITAITTG